MVFAGAMLGASACKHKQQTPATTGGETAETGSGGDSYGGATYGEGWGDPDSGYGNPDDGRSRGGGDEGGMGRGFVLS